jgi:hypothetical protein
MLSRQFSSWACAFSDRDDGDLRVSARTAAEPVEEVQARVLELLGVPGVAVGHQVHGTDVVVAREEVRGYVVGLAQADAVATPRSGLATAVHVADCVPVAVGGEGGVAMLHCGWRGLSGGIVAAGVAALRGLGAGGELQAVIGPGAGGCCYETGDEVRELFAAYGAATGRLLDLKAVAATQLRDAGVAVVADVGRCTICDERYFSHRREGADTGRQGGFAWLR